MPFQLSPGVNITEIDLTTIVPAVATSTGAIAGVFNWGPIGERVLIDSETALLNTFGKPNANNAETWFTAANFLGYTNSLYVVRAANTTATEANTVSAKNSYANVGSVSNGAIVLNNNDFAAKDGTFDTDILFASRYPGDIGNSLEISVCDTANAYSSNIELISSTAAVFNLQANATGVDTTSNTILLVNANTKVEVGSRLVYTVPAGNTAIGGLNGGSVYYVSFVNSSAFALTTSPGGPNVNITESRTGVAETHTVSNFQDTKATFSITIGSRFATVAATSTSGNVTAANALLTSVLGGLTVGDNVTLGNSSIGIQYNTIRSITNSSNATVSTGTVVFDNIYSLSKDFVANTSENGTATSVLINRKWAYFNVIESAPTTSEYVSGFGNSSAVDTMSIVVVDQDGRFTGTPGALLETYVNVSRAKDAKTVGGQTNYYRNLINNSSRYIWAINDRSNAASNTAMNIASSTNYTPLTLSFVGGADGYTESTVPLSVITSGYQLFASPEDVDVSLILQGKPISGSTSSGGFTVGNFQLANYLIDNIADVRKDCVVFLTPDDAITTGNVGNESSAIVAWRNVIHDSSYAVMDSGYKYMYDRYNDLYRYVPTNGDVAGLCARTDSQRDPWWSPAGLNRGQIRNVVKMRYNPGKSARDNLYKNGVNPVVSFPGEGTVLYGDKTLQSKPSAFDRINVRRLFIVLEKAIATASKFTLFEFNDEFTRAQFKNLITPYLRDIQGRRGITDFLVVCDNTNNTPQVIDSNQFVGDIYIKPARSINFIQLNFVAVATGVQFSEVVGKF
jgi:phage tail sheath protein FI